MRNESGYGSEKVAEGLLNKAIESQIALVTSNQDFEQLGAQAKEQIVAKLRETLKDIPQDLVDNLNADDPTTIAAVMEWMDNISDGIVEAFEAKAPEVQKAFENMMNIANSDLDFNNWQYRDWLQKAFGEWFSLSVDAGMFDSSEFWTQWDQILAGIEERRKKAEEEADAFYEAIAAGRKQEAYNTRKEGGFAWEMESLKRMADQKNYDGLLKFFKRIQTTDPTRWEDLTKEYGNLNTILDEIKRGNYDNALVLIGQAMDQLAAKNAKEAVSTYKELNEELDKFANKAKANKLAENNYASTIDALKKALGADPLATYMDKTYEGNVDLTARKEVAVIDLIRAGWKNAADGVKDYEKETATVFSSHEVGTDIDGAQAVITLTPITPDGKTILSPQELDEYMNYLLGSDSIKDADLDGYTFANGKQASNLLIDLTYLKDGETVDEVLSNVERMNVALHNLQEAFYSDEISGGPDMTGFMDTLKGLQEAGALGDFGSQFTPLLEAVAQYKEAMSLNVGDEGYEDKDT